MPTSTELNDSVGTLTCTSLTPNNENNNCESNSLISNTIDMTNLENQSVLNNNNNNNISNLNNELISNNLSEESLLFLNEKYNQLDSTIKNSNNLANNLLNSRTEQPSHFKYLKEFRVEQCPLFVQHKCTQHKPFTCFNWHFQNQRRRRPLRRKDGTFNYSPDNYCTKYDETTGICVDGDKCTLLHRTAGDTERRYHLRYYKTGICVHDTDIRGFCIKNGAHCAFAHGTNDLRNPLYDIHEMTMHISNLDEQENNVNMVNGCFSNSLDKDRNALNEDPRWQDTVFVLGNYKTELCKRPPRLCRQGYACPQYHNSKDKRRTPKLYKYRSTPCPSVKQGDEWGDPINCEANDNCNYCHTRTEQQFHPEIYKSTKCNDIQQTGFCPRGPFCAFAHNEQEMNAERELSIESSDLANILSNAFASGGALNLNNANAFLDKTTLNASNNSNSSNGGISSIVNRNNFNSNQQLNQLTSTSSISIAGQNANSNNNFMPSSVPNHFGFSEFAAANLRSQPLNFRRENSPPILSNQNNNLGPIARPRSYSSSHTSSLHTNLNSANRQSLLNSYLKNSIDEKVNNNGIHNQQGMPTRKVSTPSILFNGTNTKTDSSTGLFSNNQQFNALQSNLVNTSVSNHIGSNVHNSNANNFFQNLDTSTTVESVVHSLALDDLNLDDFDASIEKDLANRGLNNSSILEEHRNLSTNGSVNLIRSSSNLVNSGTTAPVNIPGANHRANLANISSSLANFGQSPISTTSINQNISSSVGSSLYDFASHSGVSPTNQQQQLNLIQQQQQHQNQAYLINEIHRLRDELVLTKNQGIKFEEELHKAKKACEFWMNEAEKAKLEKEDIERRNNN